MGSVVSTSTKSFDATSSKLQDEIRMRKPAELQSTANCVSVRVFNRSAFKSTSKPRRKLPNPPMPHWKRLRKTRHCRSRKSDAGSSISNRKCPPLAYSTTRRGKKERRAKVPSEREVKLTRTRKLERNAKSNGALATQSTRKGRATAS